MLDRVHADAIVEKLLDLDPKIDRTRFFAILEPGARRFALENPYAFLMATCIDRGLSIVNWTIPFWLHQRWGHLDPHRVRRMSEGDLRMVVDGLPRRPRYVHEVPRTILTLTRIVADDHGGDARALWRGRRAQDFRRTLLAIPGVADGIANMAVQLVNRVFPGDLLPGDESGLNIKPDVHTCRVLYRLGAAENVSEAAVWRDNLGETSHCLA